MSAYTFVLYSEDDVFEKVSCTLDDDSEALQVGSKLSATFDLEIWNAERLLSRMARRAQQRQRGTNETREIRA